MNIQAEFTEREVEVLMEMLWDKKYRLSGMAASSNISISDLAWQRYQEIVDIMKKLRPPIEDET